jgi:hypothetical protein
LSSVMAFHIKLSKPRAASYERRAEQERRDRSKPAAQSSKLKAAIT